MAANTLAPTGLTFVRNRAIGSNTYQASQFKIKNGYNTNIGKGDVVATGTSGNQGYVVLAADNSTVQLGVFVAIQGYFDQNAQQTLYGLNGAYKNTASPVSGVDITCNVVDDPNAVFMAQVSSTGPWLESYRGQNIDWADGSNGVPNNTGASTLYLNGASIATTATLPFRIIGPAGMPGSNMDPNNSNFWVYVCLNTAENSSSTGI